MRARGLRFIYTYGNRMNVRAQESNLFFIKQKSPLEGDFCLRSFSSSFCYEHVVLYQETFFSLWRTFRLNVLFEFGLSLCHKLVYKVN